MKIKNNKAFRKTAVFFSLILFFIAFASLVSAENITYVYTTGSGEILASDSTGNDPQVNVTLPNTTWNLELVNNDTKFRFSIENINASGPDGFSSLDILARPVNISGQNYDGDVGTNSSFRYIAVYAYAFNISQLDTAPYNVTMDYSSFSLEDSATHIFKCYFNFTTNRTNTSSCVDLSSSNPSSGIILAETTGFSSFFIAEDHCDNGAKDYDEAGVDCGGAFCSACPSGGTNPPGGSGGGGGGGATGMGTIYITPTPDGVSAQVYKNDELIITFKGKEYHFRVVALESGRVTLKSLQSYLNYDITIDQPAKIGLASFLDRDIEVSMYVSNRFAMLSFRTLEKPSFSFNLLPPKPSTSKTPTGDSLFAPTQRTGTRGAPSLPESLVDTSMPVFQKPESPVNMWTIIFSFAFVIFLIGGIARYRASVLQREKPPTVTRTGSEQSSFTTSLPSGPAPVQQQQQRIVEPLTPVQMQAPSSEAGGSIAVQRDVQQPQQFKPVQEPVQKPALQDSSDISQDSKEDSRLAEKIDEQAEPRQIYIPAAKRLELEKYIFHAFSLGFTEEQLRKVLLEKGWPEEMVDSVFMEINHNK